MEINSVLDFEGVTEIPNGFDFTPFYDDGIHPDFRPLDSETISHFKNKDYRLISGNTSIFGATGTNRYYTHELSDSFIESKYNDIFLYILKVREMFDFSFNLYHDYKDKYTLIDKISEQSKNYINNHFNFFIYIEYTWEGVFDVKYFHQLYFYLRKNNIRPDKVIFCTNTQNINELHVNFLLDFPKKQTIKFTHFNQCMLGKIPDTIDHSNGKNTVVTEDFLLKNPVRPKKALILNRRLRIHRLLLMSLLSYDNLINQTLSSFDMNMTIDDFENVRAVLLRIRDKNQIELSDIDVENIAIGFEKLKKEKKRTLDYDDLEEVIGLGYETKEIYEQTYFSVVTETLFVDKERFVSEKTFKPILHFHPFIILGSAYTLKYLQSYGFKTFNKWWDESYDSMENNTERFFAVYKILIDLLKKSDKELQLMLSEMTEILKHNNNLLKSFVGSKVGDIVSEQIFKIAKNNDITEDIRLF